MNKWFLLGLGTVVGVFMLLGLLLARPYTLRGSQINSPKIAPEIALTATDGRPFRLSDQKGKIALVFFGYTSCPDVCPTTLAEMKQVRESLGKKADQVEFIFITVDPQRDTPGRLGKYLSLFDPTFIGLTGSDAELQPVYQSYGVYVEFPDGQNLSENYAVTHSAVTYLIDRQGRLRLTYSYGSARDDMVQDIRYLLRKD